MMKIDKVYIIVLNYNGWEDTIECLESILRNNFSCYQVIVVDNNSSNNSLERIKMWAEGKLNSWTNPKNALRQLSNPPVTKPIQYILYNRKEAENGGNISLEKEISGETKINHHKKGITEKSIKPTTSNPIILIQTGENLGFAGGNNVGIRYLLKKGDGHYVWMLNNDTVTEADTLLNLVNFIKDVKNEEADRLLIGNVAYYYNNPKEIQTFGGGKVLELLGINWNCKTESNSLDYISGVSMFFSANLFEYATLMHEKYFLNWEDIDFSYRVIKAGGDLKVCKDAIIYHKETASIGKKSFIDIYYRTRNSFIYTKENKPVFLLTVLLINLLKFIKGIIKRDKTYIKAVYKAYKDFLMGN